MTPWTELGIEATGEVKAIRRAYAARLRTIDPERDPAAFQRLRQAYEIALRLAEAGRSRRPPDGGTAPPPAAAAVDQVPGGDPAAETATGKAPQAAAAAQARDEAAALQELQRLRLIAAAAQARHEADHPLAERVVRALQANDPNAAAIELAQVAPALSLAAGQALAAELARATMRQPDLPAGTLRRVLRALGASEDPPPPAPGAVERLHYAIAMRLRAELWYERLRADAGRSRPSRRRSMARLLIARPPVRWAWAYAWLFDWRPLLRDLAIHGYWLPRRLDPAAVAVAERAAANSYRSNMLILVAMAALGGAFNAVRTDRVDWLAAAAIGIAFFVAVSLTIHGIGRLFRRLAGRLPTRWRELLGTLLLAVTAIVSAVLALVGRGSEANLGRIAAVACLLLLLLRWGIDWLARLRAGRSPFSTAPRRPWHAVAAGAAGLAMAGLIGGVGGLLALEVCAGILLALAALRWVARRRPRRRARRPAPSR